jgi:hypothetical protein
MSDDLPFLAVAVTCGGDKCVHVVDAETGDVLVNCPTPAKTRCVAARRPTTVDHVAAFGCDDGTIRQNTTSEWSYEFYIPLDVACSLKYPCFHLFRSFQAS